MSNFEKIIRKLEREKQTILEESFNEDYDIGYIEGFQYALDLVKENNEGSK